MIARLFALVCLGAGCLSAQLQLYYVVGTYAAPINVPQYSFGTVSASDSRDVQFRLQNNGTASTALTMLSVGTPFLIVNGPTLPQTIPGAGAVDFTVRFAPTQGGSFSSTLAADGVSLTVVGTGVPAVSVSVSDGNGGLMPLGAGSGIDFGALARGSTMARQVVLTNSTQTSLSVQNIAVVNMLGTAFQMKSAALPVPLAAGASATLEVDFSPASNGPQQGALEIDQHSIPLSGVGIDPPFPQPVIVVTLPSPASAEQGTLSVNLASASQATGTGQVQMAFTPAHPSANADSGILFVANSSQTVGFSVNQGDTSGHFDSSTSTTFQTGTTAGIITLTVTLGAFTEISTVNIPDAPINIDSTQALYTSGGLDLELTGFDNTRTASKMSFTFRDANGAVLGGGPITSDQSVGFGQFFTTSDEGGMFALHAFFPVTAGNASLVASIEVQMANSAGTSSTAKAYFH